MNLRTEIPLSKKESNQIDYHSKLLLIGSCFVENIGDKLEYFKFQNYQNPFGILFNPMVIERFIENAIAKKRYLEDAVFFHNERWHCFDAHSDLSHPSKEKLLENLNEGITRTNSQIVETTHIIFTLGTAWVYKHRESNQVVANCHKIPQNKFEKQLLSIKDIEESLRRMMDLLKKVNPGASVIFTISPVRHLKDGFVENQQSKAHLIAALHNLRRTDASVFYFPGYELMMDELRDYRFYNEDMIHPNGTAIQYIWNKFNAVWISEAAAKTMAKVQLIQKGISHKPFNTESQEYSSFKKDLIIKKEQLCKAYPHILFQDFNLDC